MTLPCFASSMNSSRLGVSCGVICCRVASLVYTFACSSPLPWQGRGQGEGRRFSFRRFSKPLTSILSPFSKGRGGQKHSDFVEAFKPEAICDGLSKLWVQERGIAQGFACHHG